MSICLPFHLVPQGAQEHVFEALRARAQVTDLHPRIPRRLEQQLGAGAVGEEDAIPVLALAPLAAEVLEVGEEPGRVALEPDVVDAAPGAREAGDGTRSRRLALAEDDHVVADLLDD